MLSMLLTLSMVFGLFAAMPLTVSAGKNRSTVDVTMLAALSANTVSVDNKKSSSDSQWEYDYKKKVLTLKTKEGQYLLTGTHHDMQVVVRGDDTNISLDNLNITYNSGTAFIINSSAKVIRINLKGNNVITGSIGNNGALVFEGEALSFAGSGNLEVRNQNLRGSAILLSKNTLQMHVKGRASVTAGDDSRYGIYCERDKISSQVGDRGTWVFIDREGALTAKGQEAGIVAPFGDLFMRNAGTSDSHSFFAESSAGYGVLALKSLRVDGNNYTLHAGGSIAGISVVNNLTLGSTDQPHATVAATGIYGKAIVCPNTIKMYDGAQLFMSNWSSSAESHRFTRGLNATSYRWRTMLGATTSDLLWEEEISVTIPADKMDALVRREPSTLLLLENPAYNIPASAVGKAITPINLHVPGSVYGGSGGRTFSATGLPAGITISSSGIISGTPTTAGTAGTATITVRDSASATSSIDITYGKITDLIVTGSYELSGVTLGIPITPLDVSGAVSNGKSPYTFTAVGFPAGISISEPGVISGSPTNISSSSGTAVITVTDSEGTTASFELSYGAIAGLTFTYESSFAIPASVVGTAITPVDVSTGVSSGTPPYTFSALGLHDGITINSSSGVISGTPTTPGIEKSVSVTVADSSGVHRTIYIRADKVRPVEGLWKDEDYWISSANNSLGEPIYPLYLTNAVQGGVKPYSYEIADMDPLPDGIHLDYDTGLIFGWVIAPYGQIHPQGSSTVSVTDSIGDVALVNLMWEDFGQPANMGFTRVPAEQDIPAAVAGQLLTDVKPNASSYSYASALTGGIPPYTFSATGLPEGIYMNPDGYLYGVLEMVQAAGIATISAIDRTGITTADLAINYGEVMITQALLTFDYHPAYDIPASTVGMAITSINVSGGVLSGMAPYTFSAMGLPDGITISAAGVISGTPTEEEEAGTAVIFVEDNASESAEISIDYGAVTLPGTPLSFTHDPDYDIPISTVGSAINSIKVAPGAAGGTSPYTYSATNLPAGITINAAGLITGTPTTAGSAGMATITVTDNDSPTPKMASITISYGAVYAAGTPLAFTGSAAFDIPASIAGTPIANINAASGVAGGTAPHTFSADDLPDGLFINSKGVIMGTPDAAGAAGTATITVTDSDSPTPNTASITINYGTIYAAGTTLPTVSPDSLSIRAGETGTFTVSLGSTGATSATVVSSNTAVATVSTGTTAGGIITVTGAAAGSANITITFNDVGNTRKTVAVTVTADAVVPITHTVNFDPNGGTRTGGGELAQTVASGGAAIAPTVVRSGYTFAGWDKVFANVTQDMTVTAGWNYDGTGTGTGGGGGGGGGGGPAGPAVPAPPVVPSSLDKETDTFDKTNGRSNNKAISVTLTPGSGMLMQIKNGDSILKEGEDYTKDGNTFTLTKAYLQTLPNGTHTIVFDMNTGTDPSIVITVRGTLRAAAETTDSGTGGGTDDFVFPFGDIPEDAWYRQDVEAAFRSGLINGKSATTFEPEANITFAEVVKLAACMHQLYYNGEVTLEVGVTDWYSTYAEYALEHGILAEGLSDSADVMATRADFVNIFYGAIAENEYAVINEVADDAIPDVKLSDRYAARIYAFYRAGILVGSDAQGTFNPASNIARSEVAAILTRMLDAAARRPIKLE